MADLEDRPALAVWADVVPEKWGAGCWVGAHVVEEVGGVEVHAVVDNDCFVLSWDLLVGSWDMYGAYVYMADGRGRGRISVNGLGFTYSHGAVVLLMMGVLWV